MTIIDSLEKHTKEQPNKIIFKYIRDENLVETITFKNLDDKAREIATELQKKCNKGDRVLLLYMAGLEFITAFMGCLYAGVIAVPASVERKNKNRLKSIILDCDAKIILTSKKVLELKKNIFESNNFLLNLELFVTDEELETRAILNKHLNSVAFLQYTSGSTGNPKGVVITHDNLIDNLAMMNIAFDYREETVVASWLPHFHDMGLILGILESIYAGTQTILMSPTYFIQKPIRWLEIINKYKVTISGGPNFSYELCLNIKDEDLRGINLKSWKTAYNGAEPISFSVLEKFSKKFSNYGFNNVSHYPCYGMAETTLFITGGCDSENYSTINVDSDAFKYDIVKEVKDKNKKSQQFVSVGYTWCNHDFIIVNKNGKKTFEGVGEIWVKGPSIANGYWNKEKKTKETFHNSIKEDNYKYLKTGDLGFIHSNNLFISGRKKDLIIINGENYYPQDIEKSIYSSSEVFKNSGAAVFSIEDNGIEKIIIIQEIARIFLRKIDMNETIQNIQNIISLEYSIPIYDIVLIKPGQLKKTSSGKIQRYKNKEAYLDKNFSFLQSKISLNRVYVNPRNEVEYRLAKICTKIFNIKNIGIYDNFFDTGGNSLLFTQLLLEIKSEFHIELTIDDIFDSLNIEKLALKVKSIDFLINNIQETKNREIF